MDQALKNNQDAMNYAKTAEGALDEVNRLLRDARSLAVAYSGSLDSNQLQANQDQLNSIMASIDRIRPTPSSARRSSSTAAQASTRRSSTAPR
jgi:flagellin